MVNSQWDCFVEVTEEKRRVDKDKQELHRQHCVYCNESTFSEPVQTPGCLSTHWCACRTNGRTGQDRTEQERAERVGVLLTLISYDRQPPNPDGSEVSDGHRTPFPGNRYWLATDQSPDFWWRLIMLFLFLPFSKCPVNFASLCLRRRLTSTCLHLAGGEVREQKCCVSAPSVNVQSDRHKRKTATACEAQLGSICNM